MAPRPGTIVDAVTAKWADARAQLATFREWRHRLVRELSELPDTMERLRHGVASFELVGQRLAKSSASLEQIADVFQSTIAGPAHRSAHALDELREQVDALAEGVGAPDQVAESLKDVRRAFDAIADLNPFLPRSRRPEDRDPR